MSFCSAAGRPAAERNALSRSGLLTDAFPGALSSGREVRRFGWEDLSIRDADGARLVFEAVWVWGQGHLATGGPWGCFRG